MGADQGKAENSEAREPELAALIEQDERVGDVHADGGLQSWRSDDMRAKLAELRGRAQLNVGQACA